METVTIIVMATLALAFSPLAVRGEKRAAGQEQETHRSLPASGSWPEQWGQRKLYRGEQALIYAQKKSAADQVAQVVRQVVEDAKRDGVTKPALGLIVVIDAQEKLPIELATLTGILGDSNSPRTDERAKECLKAIREARKLSDHAGADMNSLAAVLPIPLRPAALPKIAKEFPDGVDREVRWCLLVPTDPYLRAAWTTIRDAIANDDGVSWKDRLAVRTIFLLTAHTAGEEMRKARQAGLYELLVEGQASWSNEQKKEKVKAYRQKLGLDRESKPQADQKQTDTKQRGESGSG